MNMPAVISLFTLFFSMQIFANDKLNACFITINSSEEKHLFKKSLSEGENAGKFNFHEFIPDQASDNKWFQKACKQNIRCDILVVSGHYGGKFFGEGNYELDMKELESASCNNACPNLLSSPKEVFLLGCNTLAGKEKDRRDPIDYLNTLLRDGFDLDEASLYTEQRYGHLGSSFKDAMKRIFKGVPRLYGFDSLAPSGSSISPYLTKYLAKKSDYSDHLLEIEVKKSLSMMRDFEENMGENNDLSKSLAITHFDQTPGLADPCYFGANYSSLSDKQKIMSNICKLNNDSYSTENKMDLVESMLLEKDIEDYIPSINNFLDDHKFDDDFKKRIGKNPQIKARFDEILNQTKTGLGMLKVADIGRELGLVEEAQLKVIESNAVKSYLKKEYNPYLKQAICSYKRAREVRVSLSDIDTSRLNDLEYQSLLQCIKVDDVKINEKLIKLAVSSSKPELVTSSLLTLSTSSNLSQKNINDLERLSQEGHAAAFFTLTKNGVTSRAVEESLSQYLKSTERIELAGRSDSISKMALYSLDKIKLKDNASVKSISHTVKSMNYPLKTRAYFVAKSLVNLHDSKAKANISALSLEDTEFEGYIRAYITAILKK